MKKITLSIFLLITSFGFSQTLTGTWKMSPQAAAFAVGPSQGSGAYYANDVAAITTRACFFDDEYVFNANGTFNNVLGSQTWLEAWQGVAVDACGTPVAPHNGSNAATWSATATSVTLSGVGAYLGLAKDYNGGELTSPANAPASITYIITSLTATTLTLDINVGTGLWWRFILAKQGLAPSCTDGIQNGDETGIDCGGSCPNICPQPVTLTGTWRMKPQAAAFAVGPSQGDGSYYANDVAAITARACFFDDDYIFNANGTFNNALGPQSWIEGWQGGTDACGTPVAPHNGSNAATWSTTATTVTLTGVGAYLGLAKAYNGGELSSPANAPASITYLITSLTATTLTLDINIGPNLWWRFVLAKQGVAPTCTDGIQNGDETGVDCGGANCPVCSTQIDLPVTFEGTAIDYTVIDFGNNQSTKVIDPTNPSNTVIRTVKPTSAPLWAGTTIGSVLANPIALTAVNTIMTVRVWSPDAGIPIRLKVEDPTDPTHSCETQTNTTVANGWQTMEFNFANQASGTAALNPAYTFKRVSIFFNFGTDGATAGEKTYYFDDVKFGPALANAEFSLSNVAIFPNPATNVLNIQSVKIIDAIEIYNLLGQKIVQAQPSTTSYSVDISTLEAGIYVVKSISDGIISTQQLIKK
jgi:Secretion system C-terminal sorting domain